MATEMAVISQETFALESDFVYNEQYFSLNVVFVAAVPNPARRIDQTL